MPEVVKTLDDLARLANVSAATVSRALRDNPAVNAKTKQKILRLAVEHGFPFQRYSPTGALNAEGCISVVIPPPLERQSRLFDPFLMELLAAIAEAARERHCDMTVSHFTPRSRDDLIEVLQYTRADGIIFLGQSSFHEAFNELADRRYRFVVWGAELAGQRYCSVGSDNRGGAMRATRHLLRLGRNRIAFLGSPLNPEIEQRLAGYRTAILDANLAIDERLIVGSYFDLEAAESAIDALVASRVRFDAIVASSDILAFAAIRSLTRHGLRVPEDVAIVGYDNVSLGRYIRPALSTISQDVGMAGRMLVSKLLTPGPIVMPKSDRLATNLIVRESCGG